MHTNFSIIVSNCNQLEALNVFFDSALYNFCYLKLQLFLENDIHYTVSKANLDLGKNMLLLENPQFLPNYNETLPK